MARLPCPGMPEITAQTALSCGQEYIKKMQAGGGMMSGANAGMFSFSPLDCHTIIRSAGNRSKPSNVALAYFFFFFTGERKHCDGFMTYCVLLLGRGPSPSPHCREWCLTIDIVAILAMKQ